MPDFTIIGLFEDTGETYCNWAHGVDEHDAMRNVASSAEHRYGHGLTIIGAIKGKHEMVSACEDSGKAASAEDLASDEEDEDVD